MGRQIPVANHVRALRERHSMTQADLGERVSVTRQTVAAIEKRQYSPSLETAFRISRVFGVALTDVFYWEE